MCQRARGVDPFKSVLRQWQRREKWRTNGQWVYRRPEIVKKSGQREFQRPSATTRVGFSFDNIHFQSTLRENDGGRKAIRAGTDHTSLCAHCESSLSCGFAGMLITVGERPRSAT